MLQVSSIKNRHTTLSKFHICCKSGKVVLPEMKTSPPLLHQLLYDRTSKHSKNFQVNIRTYNAMFSFTSPGTKFYTTYSKVVGPPTLRLHGQTCHRIRTMLPEIGEPPQYAQLYIFYTNNEVENRLYCFRDNKKLEKDIITSLK
ncbi:unnamed protein product [Lathyrus sativus]|nr:unnamed protein product [Lathyrus sativus]